MLVNNLSTILLNKNYQLLKFFNLNQNIEKWNLKSMEKKIPVWGQFSVGIFFSFSLYLTLLNQKSYLKFQMLNTHVYMYLYLKYVICLWQRYEIKSNLFTSLVYRIKSLFMMYNMKISK